MATEVVKTKKVRSGNRVFVKRIMNNVEDVFKDEVNNVNLSLLRSYRKILVEKRELIQKLDDEIIDKMSESADFEAEIMEASDLSTAISISIDKIDDLLNECSKQPDEINESLNASSSSSSKMQSNSAKLPKLLLNTFNGNPTEWQAFWDSFESAIDKNLNLSDVDKFNYLKSLVKGSAAGTIAGFSLSSENYNEAIKLLKERYGNKQLVITAHMDSFLKLPSVNSTSDLKQLRQLYDRVKHMKPK